MNGKSLVVGDIGGTHARFAIARVKETGLPLLEHLASVPVSSHARPEAAMCEWLKTVPGPRPTSAHLAVACPTAWATSGEPLRFTNSGWTLDADGLASALGFEEVKTLNDLEAVAHAVTRAGPADLALLCGPPGGLPAAGVVSVIGLGTGLGVAMLVRQGSSSTVIATEAGHIGFAPADSFDDLLLTAMRRWLDGRVSVERLVSGEGLAAILLALGGAPAEDARSLWSDAIVGKTADAAAALERFLGLFGSVAGDLALAHGARAVVIAGGLAARLAEHLGNPVFSARFCAKGRSQPLMARIPVMRLLLPEPGLMGAALA